MKKFETMMLEKSYNPMLLPRFLIATSYQWVLTSSSNLRIVHSDDLGETMPRTEGTSSFPSHYMQEERKEEVKTAQKKEYDFRVS